MFRIRLLNTTAWFLAPDGPGESAPPPTEGTTTPPAAEEQTAGGTDSSQGEGNNDSEEGGADNENDTGEEGNDDEDEFADLTPEQRAKVQARIERETRWRDRQIDRLYSKKRTAEAEAEAAAVIAAGRTVSLPDTAPLTPEQVRIEAQKLNAKDKYDEDCNATDAAGRAAFGDKWSEAVAKLPKMGGIEIADMVNILATDNPAMVLYTLANNPDKYEQVMSLPPARRVNEFVKLGLKPLPKATSREGSKRPSTATPPVVPITGGRATAAKTVNLFDDKVPDEDWYRVRNETRKKKFTQV